MRAVLADGAPCDAAPGGVDADLDAAQRVDRRVDRRLGAVVVGDVTRMERAAERLGDLGSGRLRPVDDGDLATALDDPLGRRPGHARCAADDHGPTLCDLHACLPLFESSPMMSRRRRSGSVERTTGRLLQVSSAAAARSVGRRGRRRRRARRDRHVRSSPRG